MILNYMNYSYNESSENPSAEPSDVEIRRCKEKKVPHAETCRGEGSSAEKCFPY